MDIWLFNCGQMEKESFGLEVNCSAKNGPILDIAEHTSKY
jgi:hypothetical protein